jgi:hypothetical protein
MSAPQKDGLGLDAVVREGVGLMERLMLHEPSALQIEARNYIERMIVLVQDEEAEIARLQPDRLVPDLERKAARAARHTMRADDAGRLAQEVVALCAEIARLRSLTEKPGEQRIEGHCGGWIAGWDRHIVFNPDDPDVQIPATGPATLLIHGAPPEQSEK